MHKDITIMELFSKNYRVNEFFKGIAKLEIDIAYRILAYLDPDPMEKNYNTDPETMKLLIAGVADPSKLTKAASRIIAETNADVVDDGHWSGSLLNDAVGLINILLPKYVENKATEKDKKRIQLTEELKALDNE